MINRKEIMEWRIRTTMDWIGRDIKAGVFTEHGLDEALTWKQDLSRELDESRHETLVITDEED